MEINQYVVFTTEHGIEPHLFLDRTKAVEHARKLKDHLAYHGLVIHVGHLGDADIENVSLHS